MPNILFGLRGTVLESRNDNQTLVEQWVSVKGFSEYYHSQAKQK
jgi:hypothetical protein